MQNVFVNLLLDLALVVSFPRPQPTSRNNLPSQDTALTNVQNIVFFGLHPCKTNGSAAICALWNA